MIVDAHCIAYILIIIFYETNSFPFAPPHSNAGLSIMGEVWLLPQEDLVPRPPQVDFAPGTLGAKSGKLRQHVALFSKI